MYARFNKIKDQRCVVNKEYRGLWHIMEIITGRYQRAFSDLYVIKNIFFWKFYSLFMDYVLTSDNVKQQNDSDYSLTEINYSTYN